MTSDLPITRSLFQISSFIRQSTLRIRLVNQFTWAATDLSNLVNCAFSSSVHSISFAPHKTICRKLFVRFQKIGWGYQVSDKTFLSETKLIIGRGIWFSKLPSPSTFAKYRYSLFRLNRGKINGNNVHFQIYGCWWHHFWKDVCDLPECIRWYGWTLNRGGKSEA